jgi:hypothetical protein
LTNPEIQFETTTKRFRRAEECDKAGNKRITKQKPSSETG